MLRYACVFTVNTISGEQKTVAILFSSFTHQFNIYRIKNNIKTNKCAVKECSAYLLVLFFNFFFLLSPSLSLPLTLAYLSPSLSLSLLHLGSFGSMIIGQEVPISGIISAQNESFMLHSQENRTKIQISAKVHYIWSVLVLRITFFSFFLFFHVNIFSFFLR